MRFNKINLQNYGHFQNYTMVFAKNDLDLHFIYGDNEAGKTTMLSALLDFMFRVTERSNYNFLNRDKLRIIADIEGKTGNIVNFRRRAGRKNTLLDVNGNSVYENKLSTLLGGTQREEYERLYGLDHKRLQEGGKEILNNKGSLSEMLFMARTGLEGLAKKRRNLDEKANELWTTKGHSKKYYKFAKEFKECETKLRNASVSAHKWTELEKKLKKTKNNLSQCKQELKDKRIEQSKLEQILNIRLFLTEEKELKSALEKLKDIADFPKNSEQKVRSAQQEINNAKSHIKSLDSEILALNSVVKNTKVNKTVIDKEQEIKELTESKTSYKSAVRDSKELARDVKQSETTLKALAEGISLSTTENLARKPKIKSLQALAQQITENEQLISNANNTIDSSQDYTNNDKNTERLWDKLEVALNKARDCKKAKEQQDKQKQSTILASNIIDGIESLTLWQGSDKELAQLSLPLKQTILMYKDELEKWQSKNSKLNDDDSNAQSDLTSKHEQLNKIKTKANVITKEQISTARKQRDDLWTDIYKEKSITTKQKITYEESVKTTDILADKRISNADEAAKADNYQVEIEQLKQKLLQYKGQQSELAKEKKEFDKKWQEQWQEVNIMPKTPSEMLEWVEKRNKILENYENKRSIDIDIKEMIDDAKNAKLKLCELLAKLGLNNLEADSLNNIIAITDKKIKEWHSESGRKEEVAQNIRQAKKNLQTTQSERSKLNRKWLNMLAEIGLPNTKQAEEMDTISETIGEIRQIKDELLDKNNRITKMRGSISDFSGKAKNLHQELNLEQKFISPYEVVLQLENMLADNITKNDKLEVAKQNIDNKKGLLKENETKKKDNKKILKPLMKLANTEDEDVLYKTIRNSEKKQELKKQLSKVNIQIIGIADNNLEQLKKVELEAGDNNQLKAVITELKSDITTLDESRTTIIGKEKEAQLALDAISGSADAAQFECDKQVALASMTDTAEQFVRLKAMSLLLKRVIDENKKKK